MTAGGQKHGIADLNEVDGMDDLNPESLNAELKERYRRQISLPEVGDDGQKKLLSKRVLIVGAGGLGTSCSVYLAGMGVGHIDLADSDSVSLSNLPRQFMYLPDDIGKMKATTLARRLAAANPGITVEPMVKNLDAENMDEVVSGYDAVASCLDNLETRYILNKACVNATVPLVEAAVSGFAGIVTVIAPGIGPCYECLFPKKTETTQTKRPSSPPAVAGPAPGLAGVTQASEVMKLLLNIGQPLIGRMLLFDLLQGDFNIVTTSRRENCEVCASLSFHNDS